MWLPVSRLVPSQIYLPCSVWIGCYTTLGACIVFPSLQQFVLPSLHFGHIRLRCMHTSLVPASESISRPACFFSKPTLEPSKEHRPTAQIIYLAFSEVVRSHEREGYCAGLRFLSSSIHGESAGTWDLQRKMLLLCRKYSTWSKKKTTLNLLDAFLLFNSYFLAIQVLPVKEHLFDFGCVLLR